MTYILHYIEAMLPYMLGAMPVIAVYRLLRVRSLHKGCCRTTLYHEAGLIIFLLYLTGLASQAIVPHPKSIGFFAGWVNLVPFQILVDAWREAAVNHDFEPLIISLAGNIGIFIPMGFFIPLLWRRTWKQTVLTTFLASLTIELCQLFQARCSDIDDLWMNTLGGLIGWGVYLLLHRPKPEITERFKIRGNRL
ncbi:MAG: VanZ family protein [Firmicutes bacterium HGW-Firmicutes-15]|nr:MAG: VanZ family protein [Firmicutes bacterium HGW-Firmicutes-15]